MPSLAEVEAYESTGSEGSNEPLLGEDMDDIALAAGIQEGNVSFRTSPRRAPATNGDEVTLAE